MNARPVRRPVVDLATWLPGQRWFAADLGTDPAVEPVDLTTVASVGLPTRPALSTVIVERAGSRYQLLARRADPQGRPDAAADPDVGEALARFVASSGEASSGDATVRAHWAAGAPAPGRSPARPLGADQSNTSLVIGGTHALKLFRRLHPGPHPEVEVGQHLAAVARPSERLPVAPLAGWWELELDGERTVLGVVQELVAGAVGAWSLTLSGLAADPGALLGGLHRLGTDLARLHDALARPAPSQAPTATMEGLGRHADDGPGGFGTVALTGAAIDDLADQVGREAEEGPAPRTAASSVRDLARAIIRRLGTDLGRAVRTHGDLHLGQVVLGADGWVVLDFEGEPGRPLDERRRHASPLRDVAGMARSFAYAAATHHRTGGSRPIAGWESAARAAFLDGYLATVDPSLLPASAADTVRLLHLFELEKVVYEMAYEARYRPDWLPIPEAGLARLLEVDP